MPHRVMRAQAGLLLAALLATPLAAPSAAVTDYLADATRLANAGDLAAARLQLRNAIKADPRNAAAHYQLGQIDLQLGDPAAAEKEAHTAADQGYDARATTELLTAAYLNEGRARDLLRDFPAGQGAPDLAAITAVARGKAQMQLGHPDQAETSFADARRLAPGSTAPLLAEAMLAMSRKDMALASEKVDAVLAIDPNSTEALERKSGLLAEKGDQAGAIAAANKAVAAAPGEYAPRLERAGVLINFNQNAPARADVDAVLALSPGNARAIYYRALLLVRAGDYAAANTDLDKLSNFISQYPSGYLVVAIVKQRMNQLEQALDAASRYVGHVPGDPRGVVLLAELQLQVKRPDRAVEVLTKLVDAKTTDPAVYDLRGTALERLGRPQEALADYQKALALRPQDPALLAHTGAAQLALNQADGAAATLAQSVTLAPAQPQTEALLAQALLNAGRLDEAQKAIDTLKAQQPDSEAAGLMGGGVQLARFDLTAAQAAFQAVLHDHPKSIPARLGLARVAFLQGQDAEWVRWMEDALKIDPGLEAVVNDLVTAYARQNKTAEAIKVLENARAAAPDNPRFMARLAGLYITAGDPQKALALTTPPPGPDGQPAKSTLPAQLVKAEAQVALKQPEAAAATYRQILAESPALVFARIQLVRLLLNTKDVNGARTVVQDGLLADPKNEQLLRTSVELEAQTGGIDAALASATKLAHDPNQTPASLSLPGDVYMAAKRYDEAAAAYAGPLKDAPSSRLALSLAAAHLAGGHADEAAQGLRDWLAQHPGDADAQSLLADLDIGARRLDSAKALLTDLVAKRPNDVKSLNNLAWVDQQAHDKQAAVFAQRAYQLAATPQTADTWGYILATDGGGDHGVALLRLATAQQPDEPAMQYHLAVAYQAAGQTQDAIKVLTPIVSGAADFTEKPDAKRLLAKLSGKP